MVGTLLRVVPDRKAPKKFSAGLRPSAVLENFLVLPPCIRLPPGADRFRARADQPPSESEEDTVNEISFSAGANLTADPELRYTPSARAVATVRLAVNSRRRTADGEWVDAPTTFLDGTVWGPPLDVPGPVAARSLLRRTS